jgi:hypothetical protein
MTVVFVVPVLLAIAQPVARFLGVALRLVQRVVQLVARFIQILSRLRIGAFQALAYFVSRNFQLPLRFFLRFPAIGSRAVGILPAAASRDPESSHDAAYCDPSVHAYSPL